MRDLFHQALTVMSNAFRKLERQVPPPDRIPYKESFLFRYKEKGILQALIQKLARNISGLYAVDALLIKGFVQEQCVLHRVLDEIHEDIFFLVAAITNDVISDRHRQYLEAFYDDAIFTSAKNHQNIKKPNPVPRRKIRAYVHRVLSNDTNISPALDAGESLGTAYSGFVHAASANIMDMYAGDPGHFLIEGMNGTPRIQESVRDAWNYYYRGLISTTAVAKAFGDQSLVDALYTYIEKFENASNTTHLKTRPTKPNL